MSEVCSSGFRVARYVVRVNGKKLNYRQVIQPEPQTPQRVPRNPNPGTRTPKRLPRKVNPDHSDLIELNILKKITALESRTYLWYQITISAIWPKMVYHLQTKKLANVDILCNHRFRGASHSAAYPNHNLIVSNSNPSITSLTIPVQWISLTATTTMWLLKTTPSPLKRLFTLARRSYINSGYRSFSSLRYTQARLVEM